MPQIQTHSIVELLESRTLLSSYSITDLHTLADQGADFANLAPTNPDINAKGDTLISSEAANHIADHASTFGPAAVWPDGLVDRAPFGPLIPSSGRGINDLEQVVGDYVDPADGLRHAFISEYGKHGRMSLTKMINLPGFNDSVAFAINNNAQVVGDSAADSNSATAWIWQRGKKSREVISELPALGSHPLEPGFHEATLARDINDAGAVVGMSMNDSLQQLAVIWRPGKKGRYAPTELGSLASLVVTSDARAINTAGFVVGRSMGSDVHEHAVLWAPGKKGRYSIVQLPDLAGSVGEFQALSINNNNQIVGEAQLANGNIDAVLWQPGKHGRYTPIDLANQGGQFWHLEKATDINDAGTIVGSGIYQSGATTWRITPALQQSAPAAVVFSNTPIKSNHDLFY